MSLSMLVFLCSISILFSNLALSILLFLDNFCCCSSKFRFIVVTVSSKLKISYFLCLIWIYMKIDSIKGIVDKFFISDWIEFEDVFKFLIWLIIYFDFRLCFEVGMKLTMYIIKPQSINNHKNIPYHFLAHFWPQNHQLSSYYCYSNQWSHAGSDNYNGEFAWSCCFRCLMMYISSCLCSLSSSSTLTYSCLYSHFCCSGYISIKLQPQYLCKDVFSGISIVWLLISFFL